VTAAAWQPDTSKVGPKEFVSHLSALVSIRPPDGLRLSLGLSGGIDSRVLLSLLCYRGGPGLLIHTFGHQADPDVRLSDRLAKRMGLQILMLTDPPPPAGELLRQLKEYAAQTMGIEPASSVLKLRHYPLLYRAGRFLVDGGFGELCRRQYFNRLLRFGRKALLNGNAEAILRHVRVHRTSVFSEGTLRLMEAGALEDVSVLVQSLPRSAEFGPESLADLMAVRTRIPNYGGPEQGRLDAAVPNFMPFAQPSLLRHLFGLPVRLRSNGHLSRSIIRGHTPPLARLAFAKGGSVYPFGMPASLAVLYTGMMKMAGIAFVDTARGLVLGILREFVQDTAHASDTGRCDAYDRERLVETVDGYYSGRKELAGEVDWWLMFDMWRRAVER
jgi:hypothetical protein